VYQISSASTELYTIHYKKTFNNIGIFFLETVFQFHFQLPLTIISVPVTITIITVIIIFTLGVSNPGGFKKLRYAMQFIIVIFTVTELLFSLWLSLASCLIYS